MSKNQKFDPLAERLRKVRQRLGETQEHAAKYFKIARSTYAAWEDGFLPERGIVRDAIRNICRKRENRVLAIQRHRGLLKNEVKRIKQIQKSNAENDGAAGG